MRRNRLGTESGRRQGPVLGWVIGGIFIAAGLGAATAMNWGVLEWLGSGNWVEVEARLESVNLATSSDADGADSYRRHRKAPANPY